MPNESNLPRGRARRRITLADVAREVGVSTMTASRAISRPELVTPELRAQIEKAIEALGYVPNRAARALASARSHVIAVLIPSLSNAVFTDVLAGTRPSAPRTTLTTTACESGQGNATLTAGRFGRLATGAWSFGSRKTALTTSAAIGGTEAAALDPILNSGCRTLPPASDPGVATWTFTPPSAGTVAGSPVVHVTAALQGVNAELAARLFDTDPATGTKTLITRAVYRITGRPGRVLPLAFELWPAGWQVLPGHRLTLELTQGDAPTWRPDNEVSALVLSRLRLTVPVHLP